MLFNGPLFVVPMDSAHGWFGVMKYCSETQRGLRTCPYSSAMISFIQGALTMAHVDIARNILVPEKGYHSMTLGPMYVL